MLGAGHASLGVTPSIDGESSSKMTKGLGSIGSDSLGRFPLPLERMCGTCTLSGAVGTELVAQAPCSNGGSILAITQAASSYIGPSALLWSWGHFSLAPCPPSSF